MKRKLVGHAPYFCPKKPHRLSSCPPNPNAALPTFYRVISKQTKMLMHTGKKSMELLKTFLACLRKELDKKDKSSETVTGCCHI